MAREVTSKIVIGEHSLHGFRDRLVVMRVEQRICSPNDLRQAGRICGDHRRAAGHGLQRRKTETLVPGWKDKQSAKIAQRHEFIIGDEPAHD
ncbi:hypothetical protein [Rhodanobacter sp. A1T4]|uniref:hypothetical protein n=1 Tax=Rhodanobacter sp. A1T4 TaxID=2723087 RepID=UPI0017A05526|nr:hypothetical protein [Rhodanobacter sp. A1T4]MBB6245212.1 hypothetical protein [Rhodanobacter sp. A1T4]